MGKTCLDLFAGLGGFSSAFENAEDWDVVTVDVEERFDPDICADVMDLRPSDLPDADVVLAGHPCTFFTFIRGITQDGDGAWEDDRPASDDAKEHVAMVYHTLGLIEAVAPDYWFLENPRGRLRKVIGPPQGTVWYCQYGHDHAKPTDLWGAHPPGFEYRACEYGNDSCGHVRTRSYKEHGGGSDNRQGLLREGDSAERAKVPYELSQAILEAVEGRHEQTTLTEVSA